MLRLLAPLAIVSLASTASAATLAWEDVESAEACLSPSSVERQVEARLGRRLNDVGPSQALRVKVQARGRSWVASIEMRDARGSLVGRRVLTLNDDPCGQLEGFVALALALMIDPESALLAPPEPPPPEPVSPAPTPESEPPEATPPEPTKTAPRYANVTGSGKTTLYVYPAVLPLDLSRSWPRGLPTEDTVRLAQRLLAFRLVQREVYTVVETAKFFDTEREAENFVHRLGKGREPEITASGPTKAADFELIPSVEELSIQDGYDYSLGTRARVTAVSLRLRMRGTDSRNRRELKSFEIKTGFSLEGQRKDEKLRAFAIRLALEKASDEILDALRPEPAFRIRPRIVDDSEPHVELASLRGVSAGDRFVFEDENGRRSGYASVYDVEGTRARVRVYDSGRGERLLFLAKVRHTVQSFVVQGNYRFAFAEPSAIDTARAIQQSRATRNFGGGTELGLDWKVWREPSSGSKFRSLIELGWTFIAAHNIALNWELKGGAGFETPLIPAIGLGMRPFAALGGMWIRGTLGPDGDSDDRHRYAKLEGLLALTGNAGIELEFYRLFGNVSPLLSGEFQYVFPLVSATPKSAFIGDRYPDLHAFGARLGFVWRPADYSN
jgi:hypothetical protein